MTAALLAATSLWAAPNTYRCTDSSGASIYTDSPSQLEDCTIVNRSTQSVISSGGPDSLARPDRLSAPPPESPPPPPVINPLENAAPARRPDLDGQVTVPVQRAGRSLTVRATLNGTHDARLIVDTGADITILSHKVALDLGITPTSSSPTVTLNTVGGSVRADIVRLSTLAVGAAEVQNVSVAVHTLPDAPPEVDGLLGLTFLDKFLVTLDTQKGELHLKKRE